MVGRAIADAVRGRTIEVAAALTNLDEAALLAPSALPGWSRLTIACHLRYGAHASGEMTERTLAGRTASFYPRGRAAQRPGTLVPDSGETPRDVVTSLRDAAGALDAHWAAFGPNEWGRTLREPDDSPDLGRANLAMIALLRLTEVEVHGEDLNLGLPDWSDIFVEQALVTRLGWLATRPTGSRGRDSNIRGSWLLVTTDTDLRWLLATDDSDLTSRRASSDADDADTRLEGTARDLLALLLGRRHQSVHITGDERLAAAFSAVFPGP